ncbi:coiled-coil-helix-coiled-coil-helix domain containing 6b isoform X5 [Syngnathus scovelli]|uniref:coiled-coil-helix-coiled-coil-helix domain containing 6b isoform X5 n=1 Tax=Syngnathus scovelli TaxID=161590 RepID=UPI00210FB6A2|nr:MICOS complex subunit mic25a isoform X5 [Syngnathus scovelli]
MTRSSHDCHLSEDVLSRMKNTQGSSRAPSSKSPGPTATELQEEIRRNFQNQQALVQEQLAKLNQRDRETATAVGLDDLSPSLMVERGKAWEEHEKAKLLPADLDAWARQLERKEQELATVSSFYQEQLEILEKKNLETYQQTAEQYNRTATKAEANIRPRQSASVCSELQAKVLQCYRENPQQTLHCSTLAKQYMTCIQQARKSSLTNHG